MDHWVSPYGAPIAIQSDNGPQFAASLTAEFLQLMDVIQVHSTSYHPQKNGPVERQNRTLTNLLRSICSSKQDDWDEQLPTAMGAHNATKSATTGFSPSLLWFGREKRVPYMILFPHDKYGSTTVDYYAKQLMVNSNKVYAMTRAVTEQAQMRQKR